MSPLMPLMLITPLLLAVAWCDLRSLRIPNGLSLAGLAVFAAVLVLAPPQDWLARIAVAGLVFAAGFVAFARGLVGGGDVKFLPVLMLFVPAVGVPIFANLFAVMLLAGVGLVLALRRVQVLANSGWKSLGPTRQFPMGLSIAATGLVFPWLIRALA